MSPSPLHVLSLLLLASSLGCTWITKADDSAARCETAEDCDQPEDKRYQAVCEFGQEGLDPADVDMVCVAAFALVSCEPSSFSDTHPVTELMESRRAPDYASPCVANSGVKGCPPPCAEGLSENAEGVCDDDVDDDATSPPAIRSTSETYVHQDILDQFCRSFFCDREFVCDTDGHTCKPCDRGKPYGTGGCGDLFIDGQLSCVYTTAAELKDACQAPEPDRNDPDFGDCPEA